MHTEASNKYSIHKYDNERPDPNYKLVASTHPPTILFGLFFAYGLSGYILLIIRKARGKKVSVIATSTDEPGEKGLHR